MRRGRLKFRIATDGQALVKSLIGRDIATVEASEREKLVLATAEILTKRGLGLEAARFFARLAVEKGIPDADMQFVLLLSECLSQAEADLENQSVMNQVWANLAKAA